MQTVPVKQSNRKPFIEYMALGDCLEMRHPENPKAHDIPALVASFNRFGFTAPPLIDERTRVMAAGHGRCEALSVMREAGAQPPSGVSVREDDGEWMVPVIRGVAFESERARDAYVIADNQHTIHGGWNIDRLSDMLRNLSADGFEGLGFAANQLDSLLGQLQPDDDDDNDDEPDPDDDGAVRHNITVETEYCCPRCKYEWKGKPK